MHTAGVPAVCVHMAGVPAVCVRAYAPCLRAQVPLADERRAVARRAELPRHGAVRPVDPEVLKGDVSHATAARERR